MGSDGSVMAMGKSKVAHAALRAEKALHSCSPRSNRPPRANPNPERAEVRHAEAVSGRALHPLEHLLFFSAAYDDVLATLADLDNRINHVQTG
jgi:hypothetical protein